MTDYDAIQRHAEKLADIAGDAAVGAKMARDAALAEVDRLADGGDVTDLRASLDAIGTEFATLMAEDNGPYLWTMLTAWAAVADERFRVHGGRLWCRDDGTHEGWSLRYVGGPNHDHMGGLISFLRAHWTCGEQS